MDQDKTNWLPMMLIGALVGVMVMIGLLINFRVVPADQKELNMSYADMAAIVLTAVSVMVAILAAFIGALAIWGYSQFGKVTQAASQKHLEKMLNSGKFSARFDDLIVKHVISQLESGKLREIIGERVEAVLLLDAGARATATESASSFTDKSFDESQFED